MRALREASGLTGDAVARRASMSAGKLSKIENGRTLPTVQDVDLILSALGVSDEPFAGAGQAEDRRVAPGGRVLAGVTSCRQGLAVPEFDQAGRDRDAVGRQDLPGLERGP
nr:helix-turn-helix transcriptional regulator [Streptomyces tailanensis]